MKKSVHTREQKILQELLRDLRKQAGLRQTDLSERLGGSQQVVSRYESGAKMLDLPELRQVCAALGLTLPDFAVLYEERLRQDAPEP